MLERSKRTYVRRPLVAPLIECRSRVVPKFWLAEVDTTYESATGESVVVAARSAGGSVVASRAQVNKKPARTETVFGTIRIFILVGLGSPGEAMAEPCWGSEAT